MTKTAIIVQARMTSARFPKKVMALLHGKPVLQHVLERAKTVKGADLLICAYPDDPVSEPITRLAKRLGVETFAGSETNVLDRYYKAAQHFGLKTGDAIVRVTGDCPLLHPGVAADVIRLREKTGVDYASNIWPERTFPKGFDTEVFTFDTLEDAWHLADEDDDFEHVTPIMQELDFFTKALLRQPGDESEINYCVDVPGDIERLEKLIAGYKQASLRERTDARH